MEASHVRLVNQSLILWSRLHDHKRHRRLSPIDLVHFLLVHPLLKFTHTCSQLTDQVIQGGLLLVNTFLVRIICTIIRIDRLSCNIIVDTVILLDELVDLLSEI